MENRPTTAIGEGAAAVRGREEVEGGEQERGQRGKEGSDCRRRGERRRGKKRALGQRRQMSEAKERVLLSRAEADEDGQTDGQILYRSHGRKPLFSRF